MVRKLTGMLCSLAVLVTAPTVWAGAFDAFLLNDEPPAKVKPKEEAKPSVIIIELNVKDLPPDLLEKLLAASKKSGTVKTGGDKTPVKKPVEDKGTGKKPPHAINLAEAIAIAEKVGQGSAQRAERKGEGVEARFQVELMTKAGQMIKVEVTGSGEVVKGKNDDKEPGKKFTPPEKGKSEKPGDNKNEQK